MLLDAFSHSESTVTDIHKIIHMLTDGDSAVGTATGYWLDDQEVGIRVPARSRIFASPYRPDRLWGLPNLLYIGYRELFPGDKRPGHEADHSPPYTSTPIHLHGVVLN
jgi:hypothetical protein